MATAGTTSTGRFFRSVRAAGPDRIARERGGHGNALDLGIGSATHRHRGRHEVDDEWQYELVTRAVEQHHAGSLWLRHARERRDGERELKRTIVEARRNDRQRHDAFAAVERERRLLLDGEGERARD